MKGEKGEPGMIGPMVSLILFFNTFTCIQELFMHLQGKQGDDGMNGTDGIPGQMGRPGKTVSH